MSNEVAAKKEQSVTFDVNGENVTLTPNTVRNYLVNGSGKISNQEVAMFINLCKFQHLNPFLKEAYIIKFGSNPAQMITSKEAFMKRAENNPQYAGLKAGVIVLRNNEVVYSNGAFTLPTDKVVGGWADVLRKDRKEPHHVEISMQEFSKWQSTWKSMPATMIRKTAIVNALREAFPEALGGMYTEDDKNPNDPAQEVKTVEVVEREQQANSILKGATNDSKPEMVNDAHEPEIVPETTIIEPEQASDGLDDETTQALEEFEQAHEAEQEELFKNLTTAPKDDDQ